MAEYLTLDRCRKDGKLHGLAAGKYSIEYYDSTHLPPNKWNRLAEVELRAAAAAMSDEETDQFYTIRSNIEPPQGATKEKDDESARRMRALEDTLSLALARAGLLAPEVPDELLSEVLKLGNEDGVVIVPDTNALHNGALHWLLQVLRRPAVWILPLAASLTTVQQRDAIVW